MRYPFLLFCALLCSACAASIVPDGTVSSSAPIWPDYSGVTVPCNIAPLNFAIRDSSARSFAVMLNNDSDSVFIASKKGTVNIALEDWRRLTATCSDITVTVLGRIGGKWLSYEPFCIHVSPDPIDKYIVYRLIPPGYEVWDEMGIYQRCLENFQEDIIADNMLTGRNCMNCHSFSSCSPDRFLFHMRGSNGGTYLEKDGKLEKLNTKTPETVSALVYPQWDKKGDYVAFSVNNIAQFFHSSHRNRIEVFDTESDVVVYDVRNHQIFWSPLTKSEGRFETFPTFSPDGGSLYFCSSPAVENMLVDYKNARYSIVRLDFDPVGKGFGDRLECVYEADSTSASFPRISPDGRFLMFVLQEYGNFSIWHRDADLYMIDLGSEDMTPRALDAFNSSESESYHSWSSSGRWVVFSSRRADGLYTRPYIGHIDADGNESKPFLLPQIDPLVYYDDLMFSFNLPDFVNGKVRILPSDIARCALTEPGVDITANN